MSQGKETSLELRNLIVKLKGENKSYSEIAKTVKKPQSTVQTIYRNYVMRGNVLNKSRCGRPHKLSDRDARAIVRKVKKNPKISAPKFADQIATARGKKVHPETVRRILRSGGYNGRVSRKKPFISSVNQQKKLDFASAHNAITKVGITLLKSDAALEFSRISMSQVHWSKTIHSKANRRGQKRSGRLAGILMTDRQF
ncbi:transposable element Tc1 transposase [Trichonephila inaurata madagascariensis]|uniref:Transposable element Tc1 transposase n=1 Tax=Trichonephila inaurata madagascariensis TaxID=2747483 RepID=A0A8X6YN78_9ARAC|nr:transposable element Tc1 transposase [Trichonephila inaurata madagascariensis]